MPFEKVETQNVDFPALERAVLQFWDDRGIFGQLRRKNAGKPKWSFLDGPITANNPMGVHHAWGRTYKDAYNRYFAMTGHEQRYQNGFDCQGLWVEVEVEKQLGLKTKRDIENLVPGDREASIAEFVRLCKERVDKYARVQTEQSIRLGYWMDWDRTDADWAKPPGERKSYFTMSEENNYTIWAFLKKCFRRGLIYRGYDVMPWCGRCGVGISEQEMKEGYRLTEHLSVFVKFPLTDRPGENLLVWTTTPWTLTSNVGAAVNPELTYLRVKLKGEVYYVAKGAFTLNRMEASAGEGGDEEGEPGVPTPGSGKKARRDWLDGVPHLKTIQQLFKEKAGKDGFEVLGEVKGEELLNRPYAGPFDELPAQQSEYGYPAEVARVVKERGWSPPVTAAAAHRVVSGGKDVTETEGTGIVHTAPGCGQIDFQWGKDNGLPPVAPIGDDGCFHDGFGPLTGRNAADRTTAEAVLEELKRTDRLFASERYVHRYPHCWRCKTELLYRLVDEWFINMGPRHSEEGFRGEIMKVVDRVTFLPESINGRARERDWLWNMGDWMISKKRFWGLALPIWVDEQTGDFEVIGSREELRERAVEGWDEFDGHTPHRPFVDRVKIRNPKTGNLMSRVPDVGNPWLDAGIVAFSTLGWNTDRAYWDAWYPADFITESFPGQFRNWFYALLAMSTMMTLDEKGADGRPLPIEERRPFKALLGHGLVRDQFGREMHKSEGNAIEFNGAANDGYELFADIDPKQDAKVALAELPHDRLSYREELTTNRERKPVKRVYARYGPVGADVIRWYYCRFNPASNVNFGPDPTDEVRAKFHIKLWNCYAFFANYARLDGFDPAAPPVPVAERPDIDRWILSDLQGLIRTAREAFESYDVMRFCLEAEKFVDERLSNWYVRRNRDRFWSKNAELNAAGLRDKLAAYQTLYAVLTTLAKLIAPVVPFLAETMWRNLRADADPESVHLCNYPAADASLMDTGLSQSMGALLRLVSLGSAARNAAKLKVRQPLSEMVVDYASEEEHQALKRYHSVLEDELNIKLVRARNEDEELFILNFRRNAKTLNPKLGQAANAVWEEVKNLLQQMNDRAELERTRRGRILSGTDYPLTAEGLARLKALAASTDSPHAASINMLDADDVLVQLLPSNTKYKSVDDRGTLVAINTEITPELKAEGTARDVIRLVQDERKKAGLDVADKIALFLGTESDALRQAIDAHWATIAAETQAVERLSAPPADGHTATAKVDGQPLTIALRKV